MIHEILPVGMLQCNCSIFGDEESREAIVVDPGDNIPEIEAVLGRHGLALKLIVITHGHIDHIAGASVLKKHTGAPVLMNDNDQVLYDHMEMQAGWLGVETPETTGIDGGLSDGDRLKLGREDFHVLHTPGHTQGSVCLWIPSHSKLIAGDTLFLGSIGRTDLPGGNGRQIISSIREKLLDLPEETEVTPGHGSQTTIGHEKERNPFLSGTAE